MPFMNFPLDLLPLAAEEGVAAAGVMTPVIVLLLSVAAAIATALLLPGTTSIAWRRLGGSLLGAALISYVVISVLGSKFYDVYFWAFALIALFGSVRVITHSQPVYSALYFVLTVFATAGLFVIAYAEFIAVALITIYAGAILVTYTFVIMLAADAAPSETGPLGQQEAAKDFIAAHDAKARSPFVASTIGFVTAGVLLFAIFERAPAGLEKQLSVIDGRFMRVSDDNLGDLEESREIDTAAAFELERVENELDDSVLEIGEPGVVEDDTMTVPEAYDAADLGPMVNRGDLYTYRNNLAYAQEENRGAVQVLGVYLFTRQAVALQVAGLILTVAMIGAIVIARRRILPGSADDQVDGDDTLTMPFTPVNDNPKSLPVHGTASPRQKAYPQN
jgi:NADH-quinone oxidoreductase subunit J